MRAAVLTALMDGYDTLKPILPQDGADVQWVCYTDSKEIAAEAVETVIQPDPTLRGGRLAMVHPTGWEIIYYDRPADEHPNRAAKRPKTHPALYTDAPASVWLDASFHVVSPGFVVDTVTAARESRCGIAQFGHPWRDCLYDEAEESRRLPKYVDERDLLTQQVHVYGLANMPRHWGLWATGVIAREHRADVLHLGDQWARQIDTYSYQDQVSYPYVNWFSGMRPVNLPGDHFHNPWVAYAGSGRH
jgi:hypothetical protein